MGYFNHITFEFWINNKLLYIAGRQANILNLKSNSGTFDCFDLFKCFWFLWITLKVWEFWYYYCYFQFCAVRCDLELSYTHNCKHSTDGRRGGGRIYIKSFQMFFEMLVFGSFRRLSKNGRCNISLFILCHLLNHKIFHFTLELSYKFQHLKVSICFIPLRNTLQSINFWTKLKSLASIQYSI